MYDARVTRSMYIERVEFTIIDGWLSYNYFFLSWKFERVYFYRISFGESMLSHKIPREYI